jgi:hypothetical protein
MSKNFKTRHSSAYIADTPLSYHKADNEIHTHRHSDRRGANDMDTGVDTTDQEPPVKSFTQIIGGGTSLNRSKTALVKCYNCGVDVTGKYYTRPHTRQRGGTFVCDPIPCCRPGCLLRVCYESGDKNSLRYFKEMYGRDVTCAPPRSLLFIPGGMDINAYHQAMDRKKDIIVESNEVRTVYLPTVVTTLYIEDYKKLGDTMNDNVNTHSSTSEKTQKSHYTLDIPTSTIQNQCLSSFEGVFRKCHTNN